MASAASAAAAAAASAAAGVPWMEDVRVVARVAPSQRSTPPHSNDSSLEQISSPNNSSSPDNNQLQQHQQQQSTNLSGTFKAFPQQQPHDLSPENQTKVEDYYSPNFPTHKILQKKSNSSSKNVSFDCNVDAFSHSAIPADSFFRFANRESLRERPLNRSGREERSADKWQRNGVGMKGKGEKKKECD